MKTNRKPKKPDPFSKLVPQEVIGLTVKNANGLASATCSSKCFYVAGCVVVAYCVDSGTQSHLVVNHRMPKPLSCVAVSQDGRFVAAGESGNLPAVLVWDCETVGLVSELKGHLYGVECMAFSPDGEYLLSVGGYICLWNWRRSIMVTKLKANSSFLAITSVSFSSDGNFIITAGNKHLKFWTAAALQKTRSKKGAVSLAIHGKPLDRSPHKGSSFVSVKPAKWIDNNGSIEQIREHLLIYALTDTGVLCLMDSRLSARKSVGLKVDKAFALSTSDWLIACGCSKGIVQLFYVKKLEYAGTILYSDAKNWHSESQTASHVKEREKDIQFASSPDAIACQFTSTEKLVVIYADHRLYVWDTHDVKKVIATCKNLKSKGSLNLKIETKDEIYWLYHPLMHGYFQSLQVSQNYLDEIIIPRNVDTFLVTRYSMVISHSACIWDIKNLSCGNMHNPSVACVARGCSGGASFATCSADGTIRLWDLTMQHDSSEVNMDCSSSNNRAVGKTQLASAGIFEQDLVEAGVSTHGFRSLAVSQDGKYLAAGDCEGNLHIYNLQTFEYTCLKDAHDAEILSLCFSFSSPSVRDTNSKDVTNGMLASAGRDGTIHLYDVKRNFDILGSVDDHSAAVTSVKLPHDGYKILSCSADRSLVFRDVTIAKSEAKCTLSHPKITSQGMAYDMAINQTLDIVVTVGQDRKISVYDMAAGKLIKSFKPEKDFGDPIKVIMDPSCHYIACSYSNRTICMFDFISGELVAQGTGHAEVVTGLIFLPSCKHIVSVGGDGCIFVWKVPSCMASRMLQAVEENVAALSPKSMVEPLNLKEIMLYITEEQQKDAASPRNLNQVEIALQSEERSSPWTSSFKFSISRLPKWARAKVTSPETVAVNQKCTLTAKQETGSMLGDDAGGSSTSLAFRSPSQNYRSEISCLCGLDNGTPDTYNTEDATFQHKVMRSDTHKHWHTIYNVLFDLLNSPEVTDLNSTTTQSSSTVTVSSQFGGSAKDDMQVQSTGDSIPSFPSEHSELFKQYFGSLSTGQIKTEKSAQRRRYSSKYVLQRDYFGDRRMPNASAQHPQGKTLNFIEESVPEVILRRPEKEGIRSTEQDKKSENLPNTKGDQQRSIECLAKEELSRHEIQDVREPDNGDTQLFEKISACHEALRDLNSAAKYFLRTFSELASMDHKGEIFTGPGARLRSETTEQLPSILERIDLVATLVQGNNRAQVSGLDPSLKGFAGNLSDRND